MANILIIDEKEMSIYMLIEYLKSCGHNVVKIFSLYEANDKIKLYEFSIIFYNIDSSSNNGLSLLQITDKLVKRPEVIIITDYINKIDAKKFFEQGVWDILIKPISIENLKNIIDTALIFYDKKNNIQCSNIAKNILLGSSSEMVHCQELVGIAAQNDVPVLITGKTGTGKELISKIIHENSSRRNKPFITVDCASLPQNLAESILFGNKKGAFTDATNDNEGLVSQAHEGTLFLDEIGELPLGIQKTFLRVLQEKRFRPVGSSLEITSDFRLISATNRNLTEMVKQGEFREDLFFRIQSLVITPPALAGREQDIAELVHFHVNRRCAQQGRSTNSIAPEFLHALQKYSWPGNVRELFNVLDSCLARATGESVLVSKFLPINIRMEASEHSLSANTEDNTDTIVTIPELKVYRKMVSNRAEKIYLENLLSQDKFDMEEACLISGLSRSRFYELLKKYHLPLARNAQESAPEYKKDVVLSYESANEKIPNNQFSK
jgi:two-component system, NtrC family, response regulator